MYEHPAYRLETSDDSDVPSVVHSPGHRLASLLVVYVADQGSQTLRQYPRLVLDVPPDKITKSGIYSQLKKKNSQDGLTLNSPGYFETA